jgi:hypothetical protein
MATRSIKVRAVFAELRRALGGEIPAGELLKLAAALVDVSHPQPRKDHYHGVGTRASFDQMPLDKAFADGGWRILESERSWVPETHREDDPKLAVANANRIKLELAI